jgi:IS66 C-terminal element
MNDVDPQGWFADVLTRIAERPMQRRDDLLPWNWRAVTRRVDRAAWPELTGLQSSANAHFVPVSADSTI